MNVNIPLDLHNSFKAVTAAQGQRMTDVLTELIQEYVGKYGSAAKPKGRRK